MKKYLLLSLFIVSFIPSSPQTAPPQMFKVVSIPAKTGFTKDQLNKEIARATTKNEVKAILWKKIPLQDAEIQIRISKGNGQYAWWFFNKKENKENEGDWILTQSKYVETSKIYSTDELKNIFKDTVAILDTMTLEAIIQDEELPSTQFYIIASCNRKDISIDLPSKRNLIMLSLPVQLSCPGRLVHIALHNRSQPELFLGECEVAFMQKKDLELLKDLAISLKETTKNPGQKEIQNYLNGYIKKNYGSVSLTELSKFISAIPELKN